MVALMSSADTRFAGIYEAYFKNVHAYCRRRTGTDRADDAAAEVFLAAWRKIDRIPAEPDTLPWLYGVAYGVISNVWRGAARQRRLRQKLDSAGLQTMATPDEVTVIRQEARQILDALSGMKRADQEILKLSIWEGLDNSQLAVALDLTIDAAKQRLSRAKKRLTNQYNRLDAGPKTLPAAQKGGAW